MTEQDEMHRQYFVRGRVTVDAETLRVVPSPDCACGHPWSLHTPDHGCWGDDCACERRPSQPSLQIVHPT